MRRKCSSLEEVKDSGMTKEKGYSVPEMKWMLVPAIHDGATVLRNCAMNYFLLSR